MSSPIKHITNSSPSTPIKTLSPEILECIFEYIYETSPSTISSLLRVSKLCNEISSRFRGRCQLFELKLHTRAALIELERSRQRIQSLATDDSKNSQLLKNIRYIEIISSLGWQASPEADESPKPEGGEAETKWGPMTKVIAKITNLKEMTFSGDHPMPVVLIEALEKYHPKAHLHVKNWTRVASDTDHNDPAELTLARSINLRTIDATFWSGPGTDLRFPALKRIIALSPNLESATLKEGYSGCMLYGFTIEGMQEQARRERLFDVKNPSPNCIKYLKSSGRDHVTCLQDVTDISKLESLEIANFSNPDYFSKDGVPNSRFPSLRHLTIDSMWARADENGKARLDALESFLVSCNPLTTLALSLSDFELLDLTHILTAHGSSLQNLRIHSPESSNSETPRKMLTTDSLQKINGTCPLLKDITVDINSSEGGSTEQEIITTLSTFPNLQTVRFYIDLGIATKENSRPSNDNPPPISFASNPFHSTDDHFIPNIWSLFSSQKTRHETLPLKALHVKIGEWEREQGFGYPAQWVLWESSNRVYFVATETDRDDRPDEIFVEKHASFLGEKKTRKNVPRVIRPSKLVRQKTQAEHYSEMYLKNYLESRK